MVAVVRAIAAVLAVVVAGVAAETHQVDLNPTDSPSVRVFRVGDKLWFKESVVEVEGPEEFDACNIKNPIRMYTGHVHLEEEGLRYFTSADPESCRNGLKLPVSVHPLPDADKFEPFHPPWRPHVHPPPPEFEPPELEPPHPFEPPFKPYEPPLEPVKPPPEFEPPHPFEPPFKPHEPPPEPVKPPPESEPPHRFEPPFKPYEPPPEPVKPPPEFEPPHKFEPPFKPYDPPPEPVKPPPYQPYDPYPEPIKPPPFEPPVKPPPPPFEPPGPPSPAAGQRNGASVVILMCCLCVMFGM